MISSQKQTVYQIGPIRARLSNMKVMICMSAPILKKKKEITIRHVKAVKHAVMTAGGIFYFRILEVHNS